MPRLATRVAPVALDILMESIEVVEGAEVQVLVRCASAADVVVLGGQVSLLTLLTQQQLGGSMYGGHAFEPASRARVQVCRDIPGPWPLAAGEDIVLPISLRVPVSGFGSARSPLVEINWVVVARLFVQGSEDVVVARTFVVQSPAGEPSTAALGKPRVANSERLQLSIEGLSSRLLAPSQPLSGVVVITPRAPTSVRGVRLALRLRQRVASGEWMGSGKAAGTGPREIQDDTDVAVMTLSDRIEFKPREVLRLPFTLIVPGDLPAPSISCPEFVLSWVLRAWADRALHRDPAVELDLLGRTTRA